MLNSNIRSQQVLACAFCSSLLLAIGCQPQERPEDSGTAGSAGAAGYGGAGGSSGGGAVGGVGGGSGGSGAAGGAGGTGGSGAAGGAGGTGGGAGGTGGGAGGTGGTTLSCAPVGAPFVVFTDSDRAGGEPQALAVSDPGDARVHVVSAVTGSAQRLLVKSVRRDGTSFDARQLNLSQSITLTAGFVSNNTLILAGYDNTTAVKFTADLTSPTDLQGPTSISSPCAEVRKARYAMDGATLRSAIQCATGDVWVDGETSPAFVSTTAQLRSLVYTAGQHFVSLDDGGNGGYELRYSPDWSAQFVDHGFGGVGVGWLYPSSTPGSVAMLQLELNALATEGGVYWGVFDASSPPTTLTPPDLPKVGEIAGSFYPVFGSPRNGKLPLASASLDGKSISLSLFNQDGALFAWQAPAVTFSSGTADQGVVAAGVTALTNAVVWVRRDQGQALVETQMMDCQLAN